MIPNIKSFRSCLTVFPYRGLNTKLIYSLQMIIFSGVDVEVSYEAGKNVSVFVGTVDLDLSMVVT